MIIFDVNDNSHPYLWCDSCYHDYEFIEEQYPMSGTDLIEIVTDFITDHRHCGSIKRELYGT